jgi:hypothetical protein
VIPLPTSIPWRLIAFAVIAALSFASGWAANGWRKDAEINRMNAALARERHEQALAQVRAVDEARLEEQRRTEAQSEIANAAKEDADVARADARDADLAADRLRERIAGLLAAARAGKNTAAASGGEATGDSLRVLADVLESTDRRAGILAEYADAARVAGQACERSYDSLTAGGSR